MAEPTEEIQDLLNFLLPHAEQLLREHGEFYPYAAALHADGDIAPVAAAISDDEDPDVAEILLALHQSLREQATEGSIRASGIATDVTLTDPDSGDTTDAIQVELDHADGDAVDIFLPYEKQDEGITFGELVAAEGREPVFERAAR